MGVCAGGVKINEERGKRSSLLITNLSGCAGVPWTSYGAAWRPHLHDRLHTRTKIFAYLEKKQYLCRQILWMKDSGHKMKDDIVSTQQSIDEGNKSFILHPSSFIFYPLSFILTDECNTSFI